MELQAVVSLEHSSCTLDDIKAPSSISMVITRPLRHRTRLLLITARFTLHPTRVEAWLVFLSVVIAPLLQRLVPLPVDSSSNINNAMISIADQLARLVVNQTTTMEMSLSNHQLRSSPTLSTTQTEDVQSTTCHLPLLVLE